MVPGALLSASTTRAKTSSHVAEPIPNLRLVLPGSPEPATALVIFNAPLFYVSDCQGHQDQGVVFCLFHQDTMVARGGYSFPYEAHGKGRLPMTLTAAVPLEDSPTEVIATWEVYGEALTANIDSPTTLIAIIAPTAPAGEAWAVAPQPSRRRGRGQRQPVKLPARTSEIHIPFTAGSLARARYLSPGGGSLNIHAGADIALHVNVRPNEPSLVLNSHLAGHWGPEERPYGFPFDEGVEVSVSVWAGADGFAIQASVADGRPPFIYQYRYRLPPEHTPDRVTVDYGNLRAFSVQPEL